MTLLTIVGIADDELARAKASWTSTVSRLACLPVIVLGLVGLVACENSDPAPAYPDGAIRLRQNLPTPVGTRKVVAFNLDGTEAALSVAQTGGTAVTLRIPRDSDSQRTASPSTWCPRAAETPHPAPPTEWL